jgi:uncharacterized protein (TIGR02444 family)
MSATEFPEHPFWNYSLRLYARRGVQEACLALQDEFGMNVNLVLFCIWSGAEGPGRLEDAELAECIERGEKWQRRVVRRVREMRRSLKTDPMGAEPGLVKIFRPRMQQLELDAEHVEQLVFAGIVPDSRGETGRVIAEQNLADYLQQHFGGPSPAAEDLAAAIVRQAFPDS